MTRTALTLGLLLAALASAQAQRPIRILERSYELDLATTVFPATATGSVIVKPCAECPSATHRVDAGTAYLLNRTPVDYEAFMQMVDERRRAGGGARATAVGVYYDAQSQRVTRILLSYVAQ